MTNQHMKTMHILHFEDNPDDADLMQTMLKRSSLTCNILWVDTKEKFEVAIVNPEIDIILSDYAIPNYNGLAALKISKEKRPDIPFILLSGRIGEEKTIEMFEAGVTDFITKDNLQRLVPSIIRALNEAEEKNKRKLAEETLKERELLFRQFTENIPEVFWRTTPELDKFIYVSPAFEKIWGRKVEELYQNPQAWFEPIVAEDQSKVKESFLKMANEDMPNIEIEYKIIRSDGQKRTILDRGSLLKENNKIIGLIGIATDITERAKIKETLRASLAEKEALLKEVYHRVKNNLQVVSSLLNLQAEATQEPAAQEVLIRSSARVKSMALIHEMLYQTENLAHIDMENYIDNLFKYLFEIYNVDSNKIKLSTDIDTISLSIDSAIPCGLIINELISNALKYAFHGNKSGEIKFSFKKYGNNIILIISDDGEGIPSHIDIKNTSSLGMRLIHSLTKQLDGNIVLEKGKGTTFTLTFAGDKSENL